MDTSELYIKMCDCPEIRSRALDFEDGLNNDNSVWKEKGYHCEQYQVWLPRQDQIQEMMGWDMIKAMNFFYDFYHEEMIEQVGIGNQPKKDPKFNTLEQLWLAFYMHEKQEKVWDGKKWIEKQNNS